jgi:hypothetical protein
MTSAANSKKSALEHVDSFYSEPWEIPTVLVLVLLATIWLVRTFLRNEKLREEGEELCRKSLEKK